MPTKTPKRRNVRGPIGKRGPKGRVGKRGPKGRVGKRGPKGRRGPEGPRGLTGPIGRRGSIGKPGTRGPKGVTGPAQRDEVLDKVMAHFDDVYQQLNIQMTRMGQIQAQLDVLAATVNAKSRNDS
jgi:hypothetical protein